MSKRTAKPDFWAAFAELPEDHRATISAAMEMYSQVMRTSLGSVTISQQDVAKLSVFAGGPAHPLDWEKASDFAKAAGSTIRW
jgi:hypothetical protein